MERLYELHATGAYDLIVIDTPPTRNALDFLDAPSRMAEFFGGRLLRWLTMPYRVGGKRGARVINVASRPFYQVADRLLGSQFLQDIAEFFLNFQSMYDGFVERAHAVERLLEDKRTTFAVVTTLEAAPLREAEHFCSELGKRDFHLGALVLNKTLPEYLQSSEGQRAATVFCGEAAALGAELAELDLDALSDPGRDARVLSTIGESFHNFSLVARREGELRAELSSVPDVVADVPNFDADIYDVSGLARIADHLFGR
jgi:anion-transporting  ArsA/GET3 family ATPase